MSITGGELGHYYISPVNRGPIEILLRALEISQLCDYLANKCKAATSLLMVTAPVLMMSVACCRTMLTSL